MSVFWMLFIAYEICDKIKISLIFTAEISTTPSSFVEELKYGSSVYTETL
jgi:hypothetical protein